MAFEAYDDYEQSERVQQWLRHNGVAILVGIVLGLVLIFGWQQWKSHRAKDHIEAATQYQMIQQALTAGKISEADSLTDSLLKNHADSAYAVFAVSLRAQRQLDAGDTGKAVQSLTWAQAHADTAPLKSLTTLRLARADLAADKATDALAALKSIPAGDFGGLAAELRGDVLVKLGRGSEARQAYQAALAALDASAPQRRIVQVKIDNLAATPMNKTKTATPATTGKQGA